MVGIWSRLEIPHADHRYAQVCLGLTSRCMTQLNGWSKERVMRSNEELNEAFRRLANLIAANDEDEVLEAVYQTLRWFNGTEWDMSIGPHLPD